MYPPPPREIIEQLVGNTLVLVSHGQFVVHLAFENGNRLSFSAPFRYGAEQDLLNVPICDFPLPESKILHSLGCNVRHVRCDIDGTVEIHFANGDVLIVYANNPAYEAYTLLVDGKEYVV